MTQDQIKAIAEKIADNNYRHYANGKAVKLFAAEYESAFSQLLQDYCIIEREKVRALEAEISCAIMEAHDQDDMQMVAHEALDVLHRRFTAVFGTSMFNQNEE